MNNKNQLLAKILTYSGTLPFIGCVIVMLMHFSYVDAGFIARAYGAVIISFLCGIHWAIYLFFSEKRLANLFIISNAITLIAWLSLIILPQNISLLLQSFCFLYLLMLDIKLRDAGILPDWFYILRRNATVIVVFSLILIAYLS